MRLSKDTRGSVLLYVVGSLMIVGVGIYALSMRAASSVKLNQAIQVETEGWLAESSARAAVEAILPQALASGDWTTSLAATSAELSRISGESWTGISMTGTGDFGDIFEKSGTYLQGSGQSPLNGTASFSYSRSHRLSATLRLTPGLSGLAVRSSQIDVDLTEVPTSIFTLVTDGQPLDLAQSTTQVFLDGTALLNSGLSGALSRSSASRVLSAGLGGDGSSMPKAMWGTSLAERCTEPGTQPGYAVSLQNYFLQISSMTRGRVVTWEDPSVPPSGLPSGVTVQSYAGVNRVVVNLTYLFESDGLYIRCSDATASNGVVVLGASNAMAAPVLLGTNGRLILSGSNTRPTLLFSSGSYPLTLLSAAFATGAAAVDTSWAGFVIHPATNFHPDTMESWSNASYSIVGGLVFAGGTVGGPRLNLTANQALSTLLAAGSIRSDSCVFPSVKFEQ